MLQEDIRQKQHKKVFVELMKRSPKTGNYSGAIHDTKMIDIIAMFETQRTFMEKEITFLRHVNYLQVCFNLTCNLHSIYYNIIDRKSKA